MMTVVVVAVVTVVCLAAQRATGVAEGVGEVGDTKQSGPSESVVVGHSATSSGSQLVRLHSSGSRGRRYQLTCTEKIKHQRRQWHVR